MVLSWLIFLRCSAIFKQYVFFIIFLFLSFTYLLHNIGCLKNNTTVCWHTIDCCYIIIHAIWSHEKRKTGIPIKEWLGVLARSAWYPIVFVKIFLSSPLLLLLCFCLTNDWAAKPVSSRDLKFGHLVANSPHYLSSSR